MKLSEIRPETCNKKYWEKQLHEYTKKYVDSTTGYVNKKYLKERHCPVCFANEYERLFKKHGLDFVKCKTCGLVYITPYLKRNVMEEYCKSSGASNSFFTDIILKTRENRLKLIWEKRLTFFLKYYRSGTILDVGCGTGEFLELLDKAGHNDMLGVEPNKVAAEYITGKLPGKVINDTFENIRIEDGSISAVTLWEVFSRFVNPDNILKRLYSILSPLGILIISSPNYSGFEYQILRELHDDVSFHLPNYFSIRILKDLLKNNGFDSIDISTPGQLDVQHVKAKLLTGVDSEICPFVNEVIMDEQISKNFQLFLRENKLSGSMLVIARKSG